MNLNEVKKHVYFQLALYVAIGICFLLSIFAILVTPVKAIEQTSDITNDIHLDTTVCASSGGRGTYCADYSYSRNVKTTYTGRAQCIAFAFDYYFSNSRDYTINIVANSNDFRNNNLTYYGYSYTTYPANASSVAVQGRFVSKNKLQIVFPYDPQQTHAVQICSNTGYMTGDTNYNIKQVYLSYDDGQQDITGIIDNATQNTTDIINNNNSNTSDIIDSNTQNTTDIINNNDTNTSNIINNSNINFFNLEQTMKTMIASVCQNRFNWDGDFVAFNRAVQQVAPEGSVRMAVTNSSYAYLATVIKVEPNTRYYVRTLSKSSNANYKGGMSIRAMPSLSTLASFNGTNTSLTGYTGAINGYFDSGDNNQVSVYLFVTDNTVTTNNIQYDTIMISKVQGETFCPFGSVTANKLDGISGVLSGISNQQQQTNDLIDEQNDLQQEQNDYLMDDSDPTINNNEINNVISSVEVTDPLNYLLTLPISLLQKLNTVLSANSCSRVSFGSLYDTELYLPCINFENILGSPIWNTIDLIVGVGLLAIILKRFYDSISNILTLGKEKEVRDKLDLPTPMQFMASILGGGRD